MISFRCQVKAPAGRIPPSRIAASAEDNPDATFRRHAEAVRQETFDAIAKLLLTDKKQIRHPRPEHALEFSLKVVGAP